MKTFRSIVARALRVALDGVWGRPHRRLRRLGTSYGGWWVDEGLLSRGGAAICVGAGEDISFDIALNANLGMHVLTIDPTPRAIAHVERFLAAAGSSPAPIEDGPACYDTAGFSRDRFRFLPYAVWSSNTELRLFAPEDARHVSHSALNLQNTKMFIVVQARTLADICHGANLRDTALIKLDVEGAEYEIIRSMLRSGPMPRQLLVEFDEFHHPKSLGFIVRLTRAVRGLRRCGYRIAHTERGNMLFIRDATTEPVSTAARTG